MNKVIILEHLRGAKAVHIKWTQKAKLLISGLSIKEDAIPVDSTECKFGKWFYGEGQKTQRHAQQFTQLHNQN